MDNYAIALEAAKKYFCTYDMEKVATKSGITHTQTHFYTTFLGEKVEVEKKTGEVFVGGRPADFGEGLTIFDWLCDRKDYARASFAFCPVSSLPGVLVSGGNLVMNFDALADKIDKTPEKFTKVCKALGGTEVEAGDIGFQIMAFPDLPVLLKFYCSDEEFPASLHMMWDKNILQFIRYETVYYLASCLRRRLEKLL